MVSYFTFQLQLLTCVMLNEISQKMNRVECRMLTSTAQ